MQSLYDFWLLDRTNCYTISKIAFDYVMNLRSYGVIGMTNFNP